MRALLRSLGYDSDIFAQEIAPELTALARPVSELPSAVGPDDAILYFHGVGSPLVPLLGSLPCRKVLYYLDITPSRFLAPFDPATARALDDGRLQLAALRDLVDGALALSQFSAGELLSDGFPRVSVVPPPIDLRRVANPGDERLYRKLCDGRTNLLFVGRIAPNKKIEDLIDLALEMERRNPARPLRLLLAGGFQRASSYFRMLSKRAKPLGKHIRFLGAVSQHELCACYRAAHLFVSMSEHEGFGIPIVEAMSAGVPVVANDAGAVREALGGAGALFTPKSIPHVAALCEILLDDPVRRRRVIAAGRQRATKLSPQATLAPLAEALSRILPRPRRPAARRSRTPRVGFVVHRFGPELVGGAERHCRTVAQRMARHWNVEVLTSCATEYLTWTNVHAPGASQDGPLTVRRFPVTHSRDMRAFNGLSRKMFGRAQERLAEERWLVEQGPDCPDLLRHLAEKRDGYDGFVFFTYLYAPTALGLPIAGRKALFVPTAHDEAPLRFGVYRPAFAAPAAILFNTPEEQALCEGLFEMPGVHREVVGIGVEPRPGDDSVLRSRLGLRGRYLLYLGRIAEGKGLRELLIAHAQLRRSLGSSAPALVLAGTNEMRLSERPGVHLAGSLDEGAKWDALAGAAAVVVPSAMESLSLLSLEAWGAGKPVIANGDSPVLSGQTRRSGAGVTYRGAGDLAEQLQALLLDPDRIRRFGEAGKAYVASHYRWPQIEQRYLALFNEQVLRQKPPATHRPELVEAARPQLTEVESVVES